MGTFIREIHNKPHEKYLTEEKSEIYNARHCLEIRDLATDIFIGRSLIWVSKRFFVCNENSRGGNRE